MYEQSNNAVQNDSLVWRKFRTTIAIYVVCQESTIRSKISFANYYLT